MRTEVKLGVVVAMVVVFVAGGYYMYRDHEQQPIPLGEKVAANRDSSSQSPTARHPGEPGQHRASRPLPNRERRTSPVTRNRPSNAAGNDRALRPGQVWRRNHPQQGQTTERTASGADRSAGPSRTPNSRPRGVTHLTGPQTTSGTKSGNQEQLARRSGQTPPRATRTPADQPDRARREADRATEKLTDRTGRGADRATKRAEPKLPPVHLADAGNAKRDVKPHAIPLTAVASPDTAVDKHRVQPGDTLSGLAQEYYGSERFTQFLINANKQLADPHRLKIGDVVYIPAAPKSAMPSGKTAQKSPVSRSSSHAGSRSYTVQPGDTLIAIARDRLGDSSRWEEIMKLNRNVIGSDPRSLRPGQVLELPK